MTAKRSVKSTILGDMPCGPEALPCPFCGEQPVHNQIDGGPALGTRIVGCEEISCEPRPFVTARSMEDALEIWNERATATPTADEVTAARAIEIADEAMILLVQSECQCIATPGIVYSMVDEDGIPVVLLAEASLALREAYQWLHHRGLCELIHSEDGSEVLLLIEATS